VPDWIKFILLAAAFICFALAALGVPAEKLRLVALGLTLVTVVPVVSAAVALH
jgi:hypothetical protein